LSAAVCAFQLCFSFFLFRIKLFVFFVIKSTVAGGLANSQPAQLKAQLRRKSQAAGVDRVFSG